ncbi:MAG: MBL fold metallo-hydrolase [Acutalibacteraceae bacterium]
MARYCPLFSGSSGNCTYFASAQGGILIDAGVSAKRMITALVERDIDPSSIAAVFITHEHIDHVRGLRVFLKKYPVPVYATRGTAQALCEEALLPDGAQLRVIEGETEAAEMSVTSFATPHDSRESCGYRITFSDGRTAAVATDMGCLTPAVKQMLCGCDLVHIESNHDENMLRRGPYPYSTKQRILSARGHLANDCCASFLPELVNSGTTRFVLAHLSRENNTPDLALKAAESSLCAAGAREGQDYLLSVALQDTGMPVRIF